MTTERAKAKRSLRHKKGRRPRNDPGLLGQGGAQVLGDGEHPPVGYPVVEAEFACSSIGDAPIYVLDRQGRGVRRQGADDEPHVDPNDGTKAS